MLKKFLSKMRAAALGMFSVAAAPKVASAEAGKLENRFHYARPLGGFRLQPSGKHHRGHAPYHGTPKIRIPTDAPGTIGCEATIRRLIIEGQTHEAAELFDEHVRYTPFNQVPRALREWQVNYKVEQAFGKETA